MMGNRCVDPKEAVFIITGTELAPGVPALRPVFDGLPADMLIRKIPRSLKPRIVQVPCGKCFMCRRATGDSWAVRCAMEMHLYDASSFVTLTYDPTCCPEFLSKPEFKRFIKRLRKALSKRGISVRYFGIGEYGGRTQRPHYHIIFFGLDFRAVFEETCFEHGDGYIVPELSKLWGAGHVDVRIATGAHCDYVAQHVTKAFDNATERKSWALFSKLPPIGSDFLERFPRDLDKGFVTVDGAQRAVPKHFLQGARYKASVVKAKASRMRRAAEYGEKPLETAQQMASREMNVRARMALRKGKI